MLTFSRLRSKRKPDVIIGADYMRRWWLIPRNDYFNIYLHQINHSDDDRALHDHPWWNMSIVLQGGYQEVTNDGVVTRHAGDVCFRSGSRLHRLVIPDNQPAVTVFITGPKYREWGFACPKGWVPWQKFTNPTDRYQVGAGCGE